MMQPEHTIYFDGVDLRDYHAYVVAQNPFDAPKREYESIEVPGRNGNVLIDSGRYPNVERKYAIIMVDKFPLHIDALRNFLLSRKGYCRLEDTFNPDEFYTACFSGAVQVRTPDSLDAGKFILSFDCKPQRFLKSGEQTYTFSASDVDENYCVGRIINHWSQDAMPIIRLVGTGRCILERLNEDGTLADYYRMDLSYNPGYVDVDSEIGEAYYGSTNCNSYLTLSGTDNTQPFPVLKPGTHTFNIPANSNITSVSITPRWWMV